MARGTAAECVRFGWRAGGARFALAGFVAAPCAVAPGALLAAAGLASGLLLAPRANPWAVATLFDAYFGFTTFFVWVYFKERTNAARILWFFLIMALGNIAMSAYVLRQLFKLRDDEPLSNLLLRRNA